MSHVSITEEPKSRDEKNLKASDLFSGLSDVDKYLLDSLPLSYKNKVQFMKELVYEHSLKEEHLEQSHLEQSHLEQSHLEQPSLERQTTKIF